MTTDKKKQGFWKIGSTNVVDHDSSKKKRIEFLREVLIYLFLFILMREVFSLYPTNIGPDASLYLAVALNIFKGLGVVLPSGELFAQKPPLFTALMAFMFRIF